jgi:hypothetical protein
MRSALVHFSRLRARIYDLKCTRGEILARYALPPRPSLPCFSPAICYAFVYLQHGLSGQNIPSIPKCCARPAFSRPHPPDIRP